MSKEIIKAQDVQEALSQEALSKTDPKRIEKLSKAIERDMFKFADKLGDADSTEGQLRASIDQIVKLFQFAEQTKEVKKLIFDLRAVSVYLSNKVSTQLTDIILGYTKFTLKDLDGLGTRAVKLANKDLKNQKG